MNCPEWISYGEWDWCRKFKKEVACVGDEKKCEKGGENEPSQD